MRYIKRQSTNTRGLIGNGVHVKATDKEILLDSKNVVMIPKGTTEERPAHPKNGHLRYNTTDNRFEAYEAGQWDGIRSAAPSMYAPIKVQNLGNGDATELYFGTLDSGDPFYPVPQGAANVFVFVENVYQIPETNYSLEQNPSGYPAGWYIKFASAPDLGKPVTVIHNFDK